ncbi:MAG: protein required for normal CLN1 and CLN2 G1 cyclin expression [Marteilia pararefringens]
MLSSSSSSAAGSLQPNLPSLESELQLLKDSSSSSENTTNSSLFTLQQWLDRALLFYRAGDLESFQKLLEAISSHKFHTYSDFNQHYMTLLDTLASLQVKLAEQLAKGSEKRKEHLASATQIYNNGDRIFMYEEKHENG